MYAYLANTFGARVYEDNSTIAFDTSGAIRKALFKSFVAFPVFTDWSYAPMNSYGNTTYAWYPSKQGMLVVYAPFPTTVSFSNISSYNRYAVNATLSFSAMSTVQHALLEIGEQAGTENPTAIETLNVTPVQNKYVVKLYNLTSGILGNYVMFAPSNGNEIIISNISISRS